MNENVENSAVQPEKWLRMLMYIAIATLVNTAISFLPVVPAVLTSWIARGIMVAMIVCMFRLAPVNARYRKAGIMRTVILACTLITSFISGTSLLNVAASILSIVAGYQEYSAHSELIADKDAKLSGKWHSLFNWSIATGLLLGFGTAVAVLLLTLMEMDVVGVTALVVGILSVPQMILNLVYVVYIKKTISALENTAGKSFEALCE